jgi:hypothetical protein
MARGDVCIGALHAFGARCAHPPLASGVLNALTTSPRRGATQPNIRAIEVSTALPDVRPCLDYCYGENKKKGNRYYECNTKKGKCNTSIRTSADKTLM